MHDRINIVVKGRIPSKKNSKSALVIRGRAMIITTGKFSKWNREATKQVHEQLQTDYQGLALPFQFKRRHATFTFFAPDRRKTDLSNKWESIADLLVDCGVIEDDNADVLPSILLQYGGVDRENPRAEVLLT